VPALAELLQGAARIAQLQEVEPQDLLERPVVRLDQERLREELEGRRVLVTGAGGSIGSELCRQILLFRPELLVLFERAESSLYYLELELSRDGSGVRIVPAVGDITAGGRWTKSSSVTRRTSCTTRRPTSTCR